MASLARNITSKTTGRMKHMASLKRTRSRSSNMRFRFALATLGLAFGATACSEESAGDFNITQYQLVSLGGSPMPYPASAQTLYRDLLAITPSPDRVTQLLVFKTVDNSEIKLTKKLDISKVENGYMINFMCELEKECPAIYTKELGVLHGDTLKFAGTPQTVSRVYVRSR
ncbi:MAG: hypothetical protein ACO1Q7_15650 [Gemmatimonas sp.]